jgi:peptidoglycan/xylan/chitin deacetylase (PgdA/CDA1 family)/glycosyltransferase involved in cell wall biosynthesis/SAM-dependent methyltransferase
LTPRIAVVIACRDLGRFLIEALESVERQTRPPAEIVIVDDQSRDIRTRQIAARLAREGTTVVRGPGRGASAARNLGAALTSSDYLVWLDGDDTLELNYLEEAAARLDASPDIDFVSCALRAFGSATYVWTPAAPTFLNAVATGAVPHASTMMRRRLWETIGGFDEELPSFELLDFWTTAIERGFNGVVLEEPMLNYRVRQGSGYRRSIEDGTYRTRLQHLYSKHRAAIERDALELVQAKEAFLVGQQEYRRSLHARSESLEAELRTLRLEIAETTRALESRGMSRVERGDFHRGEPLSTQWGRDRGKSIDRYYIECFISRHCGDIRGRVLEVRDLRYTDQFGGDAVTARDVLDIDASNGAATVVADLRRADAIPSASYDCVIVAQTLHMIDDMPAAIAECARILRPGGALLVTAPSVIKVDDEAGVDGDFWRITEASARRLFAQAFPIDAFEVTTYGNVATCAAFLYGMSVEEMASSELDRIDPVFPLVICVRASKPVEPAKQTTGRSRGLVARASGRTAAAILAYHRVAALTPDSHALCTPPDVFRSQMRYLREHFSPMSLDELVRAAARDDIPPGAVAITLDDGYLDALSEAAPILTELGVPATCFVNTDRLAEEHERFWDMLERVFLSNMEVPTFLTIDVGGQEFRMPTVTARERADALDHLNRVAWPMTAAGRADIVSAVLRWSGDPGVPRTSHRVMTAEEIREFASRPGLSIGAHSVHHLALSTQNRETKRSEIVEDKRTLEAVLSSPVHLFAYPYGDYDADAIGVVRDCGFHAALTVDAGVFAAGTNRFLIPRFEVPAHAATNFPTFMRAILARQTEPTIA